jgi:hypothetical protein
MKIRVRFAVTCLFLISFASCHAVACVTADTDLSGGGWETSAAADPCSGGQTGHTPLQSSRQAAGSNVASALGYSPTAGGWVSYSGRGILATLVLLLAANRVEITSVHLFGAPGMGLNASVTGARI